MNSWLGFSLSARDQLSSQTPGLDGAQAVSGDCFDLPQGSSSNRFGIMEGFNTNHHHQDNCSVNVMEQFNFMSNPNPANQESKFENFLGGQTYGNEQSLAQCNYAFSNGGEGGDGMLGCVGMSSMKTWLRNQPAPQQDNIGGIDTMNNISSSNGSLSLSMGTRDQSSSSLPLIQVGIGNVGGHSSVGNSSTEVVATSDDGRSETNETAPRKAADTFGQRTSIYRGVTKHRWTGRYEAHLWDNSCRREGQTRKGRQVYLGGYDKEDRAARSYDLAALKYWGTTTITNFPISNYEKEIEEMKNMSRQEYVASLRRKSSGFSRGASIYRGVTRHHQHGRWQARIGRVAGNKDLYLGTFNTQEEAAEAYDVAAIKFRGLSAVTNFDMSRYDVKSILDSSSLPIGGAARRLKEIEQSEAMNVDVTSRAANDQYLASQLAEYNNSFYNSRNWGSLPFPPVQPLSVQYPFNQPYAGWPKPEHETVGSQQAHESLQAYLHLTNTQNLYHPGLQNFIGLDPTEFEHCSTSASSAYFGDGPAASPSISTFSVPMSSRSVEQIHDSHWSSRDNQWKRSGYENDQSNVSHQSAGVDQSGNWLHYNTVPQAFTVWNDAEK